MSTLPEMDLIKIQSEKVDDNDGIFVVEPLLPGYGMTIGNAIRRVLLSSLPGAAITTVRINDATHEFSSIKGVQEDFVEIIMNLKQVRIKLNSDSATLKLSAKGKQSVSAKDFAKNPDVEILNPDAHIASLDASGKLEIEAKVEPGRGYLPTESRKNEKITLGMIAIDAIFTPIRKVNYSVENTRVGQETNFDKLTIELTTDGSLDPAGALKQAAQILAEHFNMFDDLAVGKSSSSKPKTKAKKPAKKTAKKKK